MEKIRQNSIYDFVVNWLNNEKNYKGSEYSDCIHDCLEELDGYYNLCDAEYEYAKEVYIVNYLQQKGER